MGDNLSCCNPTLSQDIDKILYQNEQLLLQQKVDPLSYFIAPNSHLLALLQKGERYLRSKGMLMDIKEEKIEWKQVKNQSKQTKYIFAQGANLNASINQDVIIYFLNGEIFKGHVKDNKPEYGVFVYSSSSFYAGQINNLNAEGEGIFQNQDSGYNYEGKWSKSMPHGYGKESYANGDHYEGQILYGAKFGQGKYTFADGKIYNGQFYYNKSDGKGSIVYKNGNKYEGDWKLGQFHGHGKFQWTNGQSYQGQYVEGKRHGLGKYTFKDGRIYQGDWMNGFQQGNGKLQSKYDQIKGVWQQGQFLHSRQ